MTALPGALLVITDRHQARAPLDDIAEAVARGGGQWLLLRDKDLPREERRPLALRCRERSRHWHLLLSISADVELAAELRADGVHLQSSEAVKGARDRLGPHVVIGVSAHSLSDVRAAQAAQADYVTLSPIFLTDSKPGYGPALGVEAVREAAALGIAIVALGGVTAATAEACIRAGASGVAVMGDVMRSDDPRRTVEALLRACERGARTGPCATA